MHMWTGGRASGGVWAGSEGGFTYGHTAASAGLEGDSPGFVQAERGWVDAVRGGEPEPSSAQLAQLSLPRGRRRVGGRNYSAPHHYSVEY